MSRVTNYVTMLADGFYIPKDDNPKKPLGEDSYFINKESQVIGEADGVGGWSRQGIDAGEFARELMRNAEAAVESDITDPHYVLLEAFLKTKAQGSSTACIVSLSEGSNVLRAVNLGDSGFLVIRDGKTVYRSPVQQHSFNYPYQIGKYSIGNGPEQAECIEVPVEEGDVLIAGTDGLFDNIFEEDIEEFVRLFVAEELPPDQLAWHLAMAAHEMSLRENSATPFEVAAYEAGVRHFGGKYDDITVVAAYVCPA